jgi:hypothetical protein
MKIRDACPVVGWPPTAFGTSFRGFDRVVPDLSRAVVDEAMVLSKSVQLAVLDDGRKFRTSLPIEDARVRQRVAEVLSAAKGTGLQAAGDLSL